MFNENHEYSKNALAMYERLYFNANETKIWQVHRRVATAIGTTDEEIEIFRKLLDGAYFRPNSPCLINANSNQSSNNKYINNLAACFVIGLDDSMDSIIEMWKTCATVYAGGGGVGIPLSNLREKGCEISSGGYSSGPIEYLKVVESISNTVRSGGKTRRAANLTSFKITHPDILEYITCKETAGLSAVNISILVPDWFMELVNNKQFNTEVKLISPYQQKVVNKLTVGEIWNKIIKQAHKSGDPGLLFYDESNRKNAFPSKGEILSTNPCIPKWGLVLTPDGYKFFNYVKNKVFVNGKTVDCGNLIKTSNNSEVFEVLTEFGFTAYMTLNHKISTPNGDIELQNLKIGDTIYCQVNNILTKIDNSEFMKNIDYCLANENSIPSDIFNENSNISYQLGFVCFYLIKYGFSLKLNGLPFKIKYENHNILQIIQLILSSIGIHSKFNSEYNLIIEDKKKLSNIIYRLLKDVDYKKLNVQVLDEINICKKDIEIPESSSIIEDKIAHIRRYCSDEVYDISVPNEHHFVSNGVLVHNCGEVTLPDYSMCNLGSINLLKCLKNNNLEFDFKLFSSVVKYGTDFLDNVIDKTSYPSEKFNNRMKSDRPIGLGIMGLSHLFYKLKIKYGSPESIKLFEKICKTLTCESIKRSIDRAEKLGSIDIPEKDYDHFIDRLSGYGLNQAYIEKFKKYGIRNSTWTSIAPTGCLSLESMILTSDGVLSMMELYPKKSEDLINKTWYDFKQPLDILLDNSNTDQSDKCYFNGISDCIQIITEEGYSLTGTAKEHRIKVYNDSNGYIWKYLNTITKDDLIPIKVGGHHVVLKNAPLKNIKLNYKSFKLTEELAYLLGYGLYSDVEDEQLIYTIHDKNCLPLIEQIIDSIFNIPPMDRIEDENSDRLILKYDLNKLPTELYFGGNDYSIYKAIRQSKTSVLNSFISGRYAGFINKHPEYNKNVIAIGNKRSLTDLQKLILFLGVTTTLNDDETELLLKSNSNDKNERFDSYLIDWSNSESKSALELKNNMFSAFKTSKEVPDDIVLCKIKEINNQTRVTMDISVPKTNMYIANGFISHNSISISADSSYAFEPEMALIWSKQLVDDNKILYFINKDFENACTEHGVELTDELKSKISNNKGSCQNIDEIPKDIQDVFVTAFDVGWKNKIEMQKVGQQYISLAISSTCNLPNSATEQDVEDAYLLAWKSKLKGITVYRDGSLSFQPVNFGGNSTPESSDDEIESNEIHRHKFKRPIVRIGKTIEIQTPHGKLYLTGNVDKNGKLFEIFLNMGKQGEVTNMLLDSFSRIFSKALQYDIPISELNNTIRHTGGFGFFVKLSDDADKSEYAESLMDAIGLIIESHFNNIQPQTPELLKLIQKAEIMPIGEKCPQCGEYTLTRSSGCRGGSCSSCGFSHCQ